MPDTPPPTVNDPPTPDELGYLFETWFVRELCRLRDYGNKPHEFSFWREGPHEVDVLITGGHGPILAIECKTGRDTINPSAVRAFRARFSRVPLIIASLKDRTTRRLDTGIDVLTWKRALEEYQSL